MTNTTDTLGRAPIMRPQITAEAWPDPSDEWTGEHLIRAEPKPPAPPPEPYITRREEVEALFKSGMDVVAIAKQTGRDRSAVREDLIALKLIEKVKHSKKPQGDEKTARAIIAAFCKRHRITQKALCTKGPQFNDLGPLRADCALEVKDQCNPNGALMEKLFGMAATSVRKAIATARKRRDGV